MVGWTINKRRILVALLIVGGVLISSLFHPAFARVSCTSANPVDCISWLIANLFLFIPYGIGLLGANLLSLLAGFVDTALVYNYAVANDQLVEIGISYTLQTANIGFVLVIIIIAFATILRSQSYGIKQMIWRLVLAAILVNFSLLIAGILIDFSHVLSRNFIGNGGISTGIVSQLSPQSFLINPKDVTEAITGIWTNGFLKMWVLSAFLAVVYWIMSIVVGAIGIMLVYRYVTLAILLILMPIAWLLWVTPRFSSKFGEWWDSFLKQAMFLPAVSFFLWLGTNVVDRVSKAVQLGIQDETFRAYAEVLNDRGKIIIAVDTLASSDFAKLFMQLGIMVGLLVGGLVVGQKLGAKGSDMAMGLAKRAKTYGLKISGWGAKKAAWGAASVATGAATFAGTAGITAWRKLAGKGEFAPQALGAKETLQATARGATKILTRIPGMRSVAAQTARFGYEQTSKSVEDYYTKNLKPIESDKTSRLNLYNSKPISDEVRAAIIKMAISKGELQELQKRQGKDFDDFLRSAVRTNTQKDITKALPSLAANPIITPEEKRWVKEEVNGKEVPRRKTDFELIQEAYAKSSGTDIDKQTDDTFKNPTNVFAMAGGKIKYAINSFNMAGDAQAALIKTWKEQFSELLDVMKKTGKNISAMKDNELRLLANQQKNDAKQTTDEKTADGLRRTAAMLEQFMILRSDPSSRITLELDKAPESQEEK